MAAAVTHEERDEILSRLTREARSRDRSVPEPSASPDLLNWDELGLLAEGLSFCGRPLKQATQNITQDYDLGPRGAWILNLISNGVVHPTTLSTIFAVGRSLITAELVRLTEAGLIVAQASRTDRRRSELALTPLGEAACRQIRNEISAIIHGNLRGYSAADLGLFVKMLHDVRGDKPTGGDLPDE